MYIIIVTAVTRPLLISPFPTDITPNQSAIMCAVNNMTISRNNNPATRKRDNFSDFISDHPVNSLTIFCSSRINIADNKAAA